MIIAFEGIDGIGKGTQSRICADRLADSGHRVLHTTFPRYDSFFGRVVGEYLNGELGELDQVHPKLAAVLYACDRRQAMATEDWSGYDYIVLDRYVPSNMAHQGAKLWWSGMDRLIAWIDEMEYEVLGLPRPDLVFVLDAEPEVALAQVLKKSPRGYTLEALDLHEKDTDYIARVRDAYLHLCESGAPYRLVECDRGGAMRTIDDIAGEIWRHL
ncbi:MAG: dTMP kinase [Desulfatibacillaceae bacterium]